MAGGQKEVEMLNLKKKNSQNSSGRLVEVVRSYMIG